MLLANGGKLGEDIGEVLVAVPSSVNKAYENQRQQENDDDDNRPIDLKNSHQGTTK